MYTVLCVRLNAQFGQTGQWSGTSSLYISFSTSAGPARTDFTPSDDTNGTHNLLTGSNGWRILNASFSTPVATNATIYFFVWGPGWFFVDAISLRKVGCAPAAADSLVVGTTERPLAFKIPMTYEDALLCGFCNDTQHPQYNTTEACTRCSAANLTALGPVPQATDPKIITNFSATQVPSFFFPDSSTWLRNINDTATVFAGNYIESNPEVLSNQLPADWSRWSYLTVEVLNPARNPVDFYIEIRDKASVDYWSRVNWYAVVPPGTSTFTMPIDVEVGEKSQITVRRNLDLRGVTRLALSNGATDGTNLTLGLVQLLPEPPWENDFSKLLKIDVQPRSAPVFKSFTGLYPDTIYRDRRNYGMSPSTLIAQNEDREHPDELLRDWISITSGGLDFVLPPGDYGVWFIMEDAGTLRCCARCVYSCLVRARALYCGIRRHADFTFGVLPPSLCMVCNKDTGSTIRTGSGGRLLSWGAVAM